MSTNPDFISRMTGVLADGFADDAVMNWSFGSSKPQSRVFRTLAEHVYLPRGAGELVQKDGQDAAAALWLHANASKKLALLPTLAIALSVLRHGGAKFVARTIRLDDVLEAKHPPMPHVYLFAVAVRPAFQGKGLGKQVLAPMLAYCDNNHLPAYLENSKQKNLPFYRGLGFEVIEQFEPGKNCSPLWLMVRQPQTSA